MTVVLAVGAAATGACSGSGDPNGPRASQPTSDSAPSGTLDWTSCADSADSAECATLDVPLDHSRPHGDRITLALARRRAGGDRIGSLLVNPGGPGVSGLYLAKEAENEFPEEILDHFDVVAWDPRGVGASTPIDCIDDLDRFWAADRSPDDSAEVDELEAVSKMLAEGCERRSGDLIAHVSSIETVADMDMIREALGEQQISYLAFSYGTYLGSLYADAYPERVRAMVLDGAVDPALRPFEATRQQAVGFEAALGAFFDECAADEGCDFHSGGDPASAYDRLMAQIDAEPLPAEVGGEERELGPGEADLGVASVLYSGREGWPVLAAALVEAARGDGSRLLELSDSYTGRLRDGRYDNDNEVFFAISCIDAPLVGRAEQFAALAKALGRVAPHFGATTLWLGLPCAYWPVAPVGQPAEIHAEGAPPIVVLGTTNDPATPLIWAESLAAQLDSGTLAVLEGEGHTAFGRGSDCMDGLVVDYLVRLDAPDDGARCAG